MVVSNVHPNILIHQGREPSQSIRSDPSLPQDTQESNKTSVDLYERTNEIAVQSLQALVDFIRPNNEQRPDWVVVDDNKPLETKDAAVEIIRQLPKLHPIIPPSLEQRRIDVLLDLWATTTKDGVHIKQDAVNHLCRTLQYYFMQEAEGTDYNQMVMVNRIKRTDQKSEECTKRIADCEPHFDRMGKQLQEVPTLHQLLDITRTQSFRIAESLNKINHYLPSTLRLPDFIWDIDPTGVSLSNPNTRIQPVLIGRKNQVDCSHSPLDDWQAYFNYWFKHKHDVSEQEMGKELGVVENRDSDYTPITNLYDAYEEKVDSDVDDVNKI